jgi:cation:H+ antiporter
MTTLLFDSLSMVAGLLLLFFGAELLVRANVSIGLRVGLSKWIIGLTIVSFSTSAPSWASSPKPFLRKSMASP